jgi:transcriptional regulator with XRE-family HTH domain
VPAKPPIGGTTGTSDPEGLITGALLREIRRRLAVSQEQISTLLDVDLNTYRSWEHGRRPINRMPAGKMRLLTRGLIRAGAQAQLVELLDIAVDVELSIDEVLANRMGLDRHPLAGWVQTRTWHDLLSWGIAGRTPRALVNGAEISPPRMSTAARTALLERLRDAAEQTGDRTDPAATLLRRQVYFVASWDASGPGRDWLARMERRELRRLRAVDGWTPTWVAGRSLAVAKAVAGDPEQLRHFIARQIVGDDQEVANLNYWANWAGEDTRAAMSDEFMRTPDLGPWRGTELLRQLTDGLTPSTAYIDLTVHTVWALLQRRPHLLDDDALLTQKLHARVENLLHEPQPLSAQARRELDQVLYGVKMRRTA